MQWSRVKSILIVILLVVDGFLLINIAGKYVSAYYRAAENAHNITEILNSRGITTGKSFSLPEANQLPVLQVDRNRTDEDTFAYGLLGSNAIKTEQPNGSTVRYESAQGTLEWKDGGHIVGVFTPADYKQPENAREKQLLATQLLTTAGITTTLNWNVESQSAVASSFTAGVPVFNRQIVLTFTPNNVEISGIWTFGMPYITTSGNYVMFTATDALFNFISKNEVTRIERMELGLLLTESGGGRIQMVPGWCIETNTGSFFIDSLKKASISL